MVAKTPTLLTRDNASDRRWWLYNELKRKLNNHFLPTKNKHHARFTFNKHKQIAQERVLSPTQRDCTKKSKNYEFGEQTHDKILEHLMQSITDSEVVKRSIPACKYFLAFSSALLYPPRICFCTFIILTRKWRWVNIETSLSSIFKLFWQFFRVFNCNGFNFCPIAVCYS